MKYNNFVTILCYLGLLSCFYACKTIQANAPVESYTVPKGNVLLSEMPVTIVLDIKKLEQRLNHSLDGLLFEQDKLNNQDISIKVWKVKNFELKTFNNAIEYAVPIRIWSRFAWKFERFGMAISDSYDANGSLILKYRTTINYDKNWNVTTQTKALGYEWIETPRIKALGVQIPAASIANAALSRSEKMMALEIDKYIAQQLKFKPELAKLWAHIQKPMKLNNDFDLWLRLQPRAFFAAPLKSVDDKLLLQLVISAGVESFVGLQPTALQPIALPQLSALTKPIDEFKMNVATDVSFVTLSAIAKKQLKGQVFKDGKRQIQIMDIEIFGSNNRAVFMIDVVGSLKAKIYFSGKPTYNSSKRSIEIVEPAFDLETKNALYKSANWLANGYILQKIMPFLTYSVDEDLQTLKNNSNAMLTGYKLYEGVELTAAINKIDVTNIDIVKGAFRLNSLLSGKVDINITELSL